tara:strand:- start:1810 stop:2397 length:588 start_codon:yes stop_codon:yes gene_type:complete
VSRDNIITELYESKFIDDVINTITSRHQLTADLKGELFLILCEMPESKIVKAHDNKWINYMCINILKKMYHSSTSPFHKKYRKNQSQNEIGEVKQEEVENNYDLISKIEWIVDHKLDIVDRELFKMYYKMDRYDRWQGDLKDLTCQKATSSYRKMESKLEIGDSKITISRSTISLSHQRSIMIIKKELKNYGVAI